MPIVEGIKVDRLAEYGLVLEKNYTLTEAYEHLEQDQNCQNLQKTLNANWGQDIIHFDYADKSVVALSAQGAPLAANAVERLRRTGVKSIISIGTAGGTNQSIDNGAFVVPYAGVRDEGTSQGYLPLNVPSVANLDLVRTIQASFRSLSLDTILGCIYTTDKRYKENGPLLKSLNQHAAVVAVDMETATLFITAMYYNIAAAAIKIITDCAVSEEESFQGVYQEKEVDYATWLKPFFTTALQAALLSIKNQA